MAIFQKSVINKHLTNFDIKQVETAYLKFKENYSSAKIEKIKRLKAEAQTLKLEIEKTDKEIDHLVYELYGLSEDEIGIVEENN